MQKFVKTGKALKFLCVLFTVFALTGCESVNSGIDSLQETFSNIEAPKFKSQPEEDQRDDIIVYDTAPEDDIYSYQETNPVDEQPVYVRREDRPESLARQVEQPDTCLPVVAVEELKTLTRFANDGSMRAENRISSVSIENITSRCQRNEHNTIVDIDITFTGELGPKADRYAVNGRNFSYPYFLAISTTNGRVLAKEVFAVALTYEGQQHTAYKTESVRQIIPHRGDAYDNQKEILLGFQLTDSELAYNRARLQTTQPDSYSPLYVTAPPAMPEDSYDASAPVANSAPMKILDPPLPTGKPVREAERAPPPAAPAVVEEEPQMVPLSAAPAEQPASTSATDSSIPSMIDPLATQQEPTTPVMEELEAPMPSGESLSTPAASEEEAVNSDDEFIDITAPMDE